MVSYLTRSLQAEPVGISRIPAHNAGIVEYFNVSTKGLTISFSKSKDGTGYQISSRQYLNPPFACRSTLLFWMIIGTWSIVFQLILNIMQKSQE